MNQEYDMDTLCGITDEELTHRFQEAVRIENEIKIVKGVPIPQYDLEKKAAYLLYPDGRKEYVN